MKLRVFKPVIKGLTWRCFAAFDTLLVTAAVMWWNTGTLTASVFSVVLGIVGLEMLTKTSLYALHEKFWDLPVFTRWFS